MSTKNLSPAGNREGRPDVWRHGHSRASVPLLAGESQRRWKGLPCNDYDFLDSCLLDPVDQAALHHPRLRDLPAGLSEWAVWRGK